MKKGIASDAEKRSNLILQNPCVLFAMIHGLNGKMNIMKRIFAILAVKNVDRSVTLNLNVILAIIKLSDSPCRAVRI